MATTCVLVGGSHSPSHTTSSPSLISQVHFHTSWQEKLFFWHCSILSLETALGTSLVENHPQPNRAVAPRTTRCPSITNYLFPLIHSVTLPRAKLQSFPPVPTTSLAKANAHVLWELANHCQLLGSGVSASIATGQSPQGHCGTLCWQGGANPISLRHSWAGLCRRAQTVPEAEDKRTYLVMQWGPSPHSRKKHQLQTSSLLSQPPLPLSPVKEKERELQLKGTMGLKAQDQTWGQKDSFAWHT